MDATTHGGGVVWHHGGVDGRPSMANGLADLKLPPPNDAATGGVDPMVDLRSCCHGLAVEGGTLRVGAGNPNAL
jgi:hypothetical protein